MSIQRALGQSMNTAAALYTQTPQFKEKLAAKRIAQQNLIKKMQEANKRVEEQKEAKKVQRRRFDDYLSKMPSSLGGTIGNLPKKVRQQIAKTYTKYERKKIMDEEDKKRGVSKRKESK